MLSMSEEKLTAQVLVRIAPTEKRLLDEEAKRQHRKAAQLARLMIVRGLGSEEEAPRSRADRVAESNTDWPQEVHETELPVVAYAPAGEGRAPEPVPTGETVRILNPAARDAAKRGLSAVKVVGDSMTRQDGTGYEEGDFLVIDPKAAHSARDGDVVYVLHNGEPLLKILRYSKGKGGRMDRVTLLSLNPRYPPIPVYPDDEFQLIGVEAYHVARKRNFR